MTFQENTQLKTRGGRPRRFGVERYDNGRIREDPRKHAAWNRIRDVHLEVGLNPHMATQRGRMFFMQMLTELEFEVSNRWAELLEGYDRIVLGRRRTAPSPSFERTGHGESNHDDPEMVAEFKARFLKAHKALTDSGKLSEVAVTRLCRDETAGAMLQEARRGLAALAVHFGLVKGRKR